jgi:hypothetical protein
MSPDHILCCLFTAEISHFPRRTDWLGAINGNARATETQRHEASVAIVGSGMSDTCHRCGTQLLAARRGRPKRYCSDACRLLAFRESRAEPCNEIQPEPVTRIISFQPSTAPRGTPQAILIDASRLARHPAPYKATTTPSNFTRMAIRCCQRALKGRN